jgi:hypothetical protein
LPTECCSGFLGFAEFSRKTGEAGLANSAWQCQAAYLAKPAESASCNSQSALGPVVQ